MAGNIHNALNQLQIKHKYLVIKIWPSSKLMSMLIDAVRFFSYQVHEFLQDVPPICITDVYEFGHNWTFFIPKLRNLTDHIM